MSSKAVIVIVPSFSPVSPVRAAEHIALRIAQTLENDVFFVSIDDETTGRFDNESTSLNYYALNSRGWKRILLARKRLMALISKYDSCVALSFLIRPDILLSTLPSVTRISSIRNMIDQEYSSQYSAFSGRVFGALHFLALRRFDHLIVMSEAMRKHFRFKGFDMKRVALIRNFLNEADVGESASRKALAAFEKSGPIILTSSTLIRRKNVAEIISAVINLLDEGLDFDLIVLGDGVLRESLRSMVCDQYSHRIHFLGHVANPLPYLKMADCFVMASYSEGVSRSLMEALYLGVPAVVRRIPGNDELVLDGVNGFLFDDCPGLKVALRGVLEGEAFSDIALPSHFREEVCMAEYISVVRKKLHE